MPPIVAGRDRTLTQASKSTEVIARFALRMVAILAFAAFSGFGFERCLGVLLWMAAVVSAVVATSRREEPLDAALNHWDEAIAYAAALCCLA